MGKDKLEVMFEMQYQFQKKLGTMKKIRFDESMWQQFVNQMILAVHEEATEIMRETAYKNPAMVPFGWKKGQDRDLLKMQDEIVDLWHFVMNLALAAEMTAEDFYAKYCDKHKINYDRQREGY